MLALIGLKVISIVTDGASNNRNFFQMHKIPAFQYFGITYKLQILLSQTALCISLLIHHT